MWEMLDSDLECGSECGGPGPPPEFVIPPPPRPPFLHDVASCTEDPLPNIEMCEAIPILDPSYHSSPSLQTSALIVLCSVVLVLVVLISSLLVWKHKRKVQNFLPCKTPTRGGHLDAAAVSGGHSVTYEDPDAHLGSRPLVMRHQHNMEMLHPKSIHFPSGYPMTRSPPLFVCSSPGPDPYRSHDNVYEELGPPRESDGESEPPVHSDDDFAEDELSLPGERSFHKTSPDNSTVATIYQERGGSSGTAAATSSGSGSASGNGERSTSERNTLLSPPTTNASARSTGSRGMMASPGSIFRGRKVHSTRNGKLPNFSADELNTSSEHDYAPDMVLSTIYGQRSHLMTLPYNTVAGASHPVPASRRSNMNCFAASSTISTEGEEAEVERRNQINRELSSHPVATIFRERGTAPYPRNFLTHHHPPNARTRTNPRSLDRRRIIAPAPDPSYGYAEPVFHDGVLFDPYLAHDRAHPYPYLLPEFTTFRNAPGAVACQQPLDGTVAAAAPTFGRDSSFGSDSGYSQHTQTSTRSGWGRSGRRESAPKNTPFSAS
ncbi:uncharacterized protein LOC132265437 [Phlebotomus argentipes]|uniref:uncharacterized protein LOC132265437 n=1 Tax=Phlebotomus argentipes TaxID=94469 RepID=UPI002892E52E|nr:uncharacterized protein LOC132265437 [Phlebotomus argentipes]